MKDVNPSFDITVVVPLFNERDNVQLLCDEIIATMEDQNRLWELVLVDDGSVDGTVQVLRRIAQSDRRIKLVLLARNFGQTAAMHAGIKAADGRYIATMDGDLQNDPADIPAMVEKLEEGFDLIHGWRKKRHDAWHRLLPSQIANKLISRVTGFPIHDLGCTLKVMRSDLAKKLELYGEMHRFIPILANKLGARCYEFITNHRPRRFGTAKYGLGRTFRVVLDLITVKYIQSYFDSPMKLFGIFGIWTALLSISSFSAAFLMKILSSTDLTGNPLLMLGILGAILSVQFFSLGLLGEVNARIYYSRGDRANYEIRETVNFATVGQPEVRRDLQVVRKSA